MIVYRCSKGHDVASTQPIEACPRMVDGEICLGELSRTNGHVQPGEVVKLRRRDAAKAERS